MADDDLAGDEIDLPFASPTDWETPRLSLSCLFVRDGDWIESKDQGGSDFRLLQISNIGQGRFVETGNQRWISRETFERLHCTEVLPGDILVARMPDPPGRAWYVSALPWRAVTAVDVAIIRTKREELDPRFLAYFLNSPACLSTVQSLTTGTTRMRVRRADLERLRIPRPTVDEQHAISRILGSLDEKIELNRRMTDTLDATARSLFRSWFVDFDPVRAIQLGHPRLTTDVASLFPASFVPSELGEIPEGWRVGSISDIAEINAYSLGGADRLDTIDYIEISEVSNGEIAHVPRYKRGDEPTRARRRLRHGDTVLSMVRPDRGAHFLCIEPSETLVASTGFAVLSPRDGNWAFLYCAATRRETGELLGRLADGGAYPAVRPEAIGGISLALPLGADLLAAFQRLASPLLVRADRCRVEGRTLAALRDTLLPALVSGQIRVKHTEKLAFESG